MTVATASTDRLERYDGSLTLRIADGRISALRQTPPMRLFRPYPEQGEPRTVVIGNVAGGVVGGDRLAVELAVGAGESLLATTQAAEKIYRSDGATSSMSITLSAGPGAALEWLSAGTILFDGARLDRTTTLDVAGDATLLFSETLVLGRLARGEVFSSGLLRDRIRLRRDGRLLWADDLALSGDVLRSLDAAAGFGGGRSYSSVLVAAPGAAAAVPAVRPILADDARLRGGATALGADLLIVRVLAVDPAAARTGIARIWKCLRAMLLARPARMPTIWGI